MCCSPMCGSAWAWSARPSSAAATYRLYAGRRPHGAGKAGLHGAAPAAAHRGEEIAPDVLEAHADEIFDEAENRIYVEKAVLAVLLAGK